MGRPTKLTSEVAAEIIARVREGWWRSKAAAASGVARKTLYDWIGYAEEGKEPFASFVEELERAEAELFHERMARLLEDTDKARAQTGRWWFERRFPDEAGTPKSKVELEHSGQIGGAVGVVLLPRNGREGDEDGGDGGG